MYRAFYGLRERPFSLVPDPDYLLLTRQHSMALTMLEYGLASEAMITVLTGEVGSGKTTMLRHLLNRLPPSVAVGLVNVTPDQSSSLLHWIAAALDVAVDDSDPVGAFRALTGHIIGIYAAGRRLLLIMDEAQNLSIVRLEELRLLTNMNADKHLVIQLLLVGQPELREKLACSALRQFVQRVSIDYHISPLNAEETQAYVRHRLATAGGSPDLIDVEAIAAAHAASGGVPRLINQLCDMALVYGYADQQPVIDRATMEQVVNDRIAGGLFPSVSAARTEEPASPSGSTSQTPGA
jgi:type II secretory pathway predicted ATPase ExeA